MIIWHEYLINLIYFGNFSFFEIELFKHRIV